MFWKKGYKDESCTRERNEESQLREGREREREREREGEMREGER
jgi:hypothetical protein